MYMHIHIDRYRDACIQVYKCILSIWICTYMDDLVVYRSEANLLFSLLLATYLLRALPLYVLFLQLSVGTVSLVCSGILGIPATTKSLHGFNPEKYLTRIRMLDSMLLGIAIMVLGR